MAAAPPNPPPNPAAPPNPPPNPAVPAKVTEFCWWENWLMWRIPLFLFWWAVAAAIIDNAIGESLLLYSSFMFVLPLAGLALVIWRHKKDGIIALVVLPIWFILYWILFPSVAPAQIIIWIPTGSRSLITPCRYALWSVHILFALVYVPLLLLSWYVLCFSQRYTVIVGTVYFEALLNTVILFVAMGWAADPLYPFIQFVDVLVRLQTWWDTWKAFHPANQATDEAKKKGATTSGNILASYERMFSSFDGTVHTLEYRGIVSVFAAVLVVLFSVTVVGYGICIYGLQRLGCDPPLYKDLQSDLFLCCVYSLSILTTAPLTNASPNSTVAMILYSMELISTFLIATVFFGMFSAAKGFHGEVRLRDYKKQADKVHKWIATVKKSHADILNPPPPPPPPPLLLGYNPPPPAPPAPPP